ncbi:MAG TPA: helix-turn-helix domain-containing protein, partial [Ktedonobacterales bacterium]
MEPSKLFGIGEAARMLGVHRSTLHLAIQHQEIEPDLHTPRGHVRFTQETIEAYRAQVRDSPAAGSARPQFVQRLTHALAENKLAPELANMTVTGLRKLVPKLPLALVLVREPHLNNPWHVSILASDGLNGAEIARLGALGSTREFSYIKALRDGTIVRCYDINDISRDNVVASGTRLYADRLHVRSYIILPLT